MTYNVSDGTSDPTILYCSIVYSEYTVNVTHWLICMHEVG